MTNSTNDNFVSIEYKFYKTSKEANFYSCLIVIIIGLVGNSLVVYLLNSKPRSAKSNLFKLGYNNIQSSRSLSSSQSYMLALSISDTLFLLAHLFEDIFPSLSASNYVFQLTNKNFLVCKIILHVRNSMRIASAYLVVLYAWERFIVVSSPLKRLQFHNKRFTRNIILAIFCASFGLTAYTPLINGLRLKDPHESTVDSPPTTECDVKQEFKNIYDYIILAYISIGILIPIVLVCYFNIFIIYVLLTRKNKMFRRSFPISKSSNSSCGGGGGGGGGGVAGGGSQNFKSNLDNDELILKNSESNRNDNLRIFKSLSTNSLKSPAETKQAGLYKKSKIKSLTCCYESQSKIDLKIKFGKSGDELIGLKSQSTRFNSKRKISFYSEFNNQTKTINLQSYSSYLKKIPSSSWQQSLKSFGQNAQMTRRIKNSGRATIILILISAFFVSLNLPYILAWMRFFIPFKKNLLSNEDIYYRYSFVSITEIFHMVNYCINIFLYCMVSKAFRNELKSRLGLDRCYKNIKFSIKFNI